MDRLIFVLDSDLVMNKVLVQTLSDHSWEPVMMVSAAKVDLQQKPDVSIMGRATNILSKVCIQDLSYQCCPWNMLSLHYKISIWKTKCAQIFHQRTWVTLALPRAAPSLNSTWQNMQKLVPCQKCAKIYGKKRRRPENYPMLFWDNFIAFSAQSMV